MAWVDSGGGGGPPKKVVWYVRSYVISLRVILIVILEKLSRLFPCGALVLDTFQFFDIHIYEHVIQIL